MSSDFVFVDIEPDSDQPIVDGISFSRLSKEWNAVKIDFKDPDNQIHDSSINFWDKLLTIYHELEQIDKTSALSFSQNCITDIHNMLLDSQYKRSKGLLFSFFISFMKIKKCTFLDIDKDCAISILNSLFLCYKDIQPIFLNDFLDVFKADEIEDKDGNYPFLLFLIKSYPNDDLIAENSRTIIKQIIIQNKPILNYFLGVLLNSFVDLFCFFSDISPTILDDSHPSKLCKYIDTIFCQIENDIENQSELLDNYSSKLTEKLLENLKKSPSLIQFETIRFFFTSIHHTKTISTLIQYIIRSDSVFSQNIESWFTKWTVKTLNLFSTMLDIRSSALQTAFFYLDDLDHNASIFDFPDYPTNFITKPERKLHTMLSVDDLAIYQTINNQLPNPLNHVISVFQLISSVFSMFWDLPLQTNELLITVIEKIAGCGNEYTNAYCFTPGKGIYAQTQILIFEAKEPDKELKNLMANFILTMKGILRGLDI